jgi:hypothetical protein
LGRKGKGDTNLALELDLFVVVVGDVPLRKAGFAPVMRRRAQLSKWYTILDGRVGIGGQTYWRF